MRPFGRIFVEHFSASGTVRSDETQRVRTMIKETDGFRGGGANWRITVEEGPIDRYQPERDAGRNKRPRETRNARIGGYLPAAFWREAPCTWTLLSLPPFSSSVMVHST